MAAVNFIKIPCEPNTANRQVESHFPFLFFSFVHFFSLGGGGRHSSCAYSIVYARFEIFTENFSVRFYEYF